MATTATAHQITKIVARPTARPIFMAMTLAMTDVIATGLAVIFGFRVWSLINPTIPPFQSVMWLAPLFCAGMFAFEGLYPGIGLGAVEHIRRLFRGVTLVYLMLTAAMFVTHDRSWADSRGGFIMAWSFSLVLTPSARWVCGQLFSQREWWGVPVVILGAGETARRVIRNLTSYHMLGYRPVACLDDDPEKQGVCEGVPVIGSLGDARAIASQYRIDYALIAMPGMPTSKLTTHLRTWSTVFRNILIIPDLFGIASLWIETRDLGGVLGLEIRHNLLKPANRWIKRTIDILVSAFGLILMAPFVPIVTLWIRISSPGRAFFVQEREGVNGKPIQILKFRTMYTNAEDMLERHLVANPADRAEWDQFCKLKKDPRVIPGIGTLLRKTSLDEIPQLWNILAGEMSLVGPRPFPGYHNSRFDAEFRLLRTQVRPGLTGMWQVSARSDGDLGVQQSLDSYYIRNWSLWLDLYLLVRTIRVVLSGQGAY